MRRMLTPLAALALVLVFAGPAAAGDTFTQTINQHNVTVSAFVPIGCGGPTLT